MIDIKSLFNKSERGLRKQKVKVTREGKTFYREQMVGRKSPREGTGKMNKFPESIKKEILELRKIGYSGAKIKDYIEEMITFQPEAIGSLKIEIEDKEKHHIMLSQEAAKKGLTQERRDYLHQKVKAVRAEMQQLRQQATGKEKLHINGKVINQNLIQDGLITENGKLTVTTQALTDYALSQGIGPKKPRTTAVESEKSAHADTKKELDRSNKKVAQLEVAAKHNLEEIKLVQQSKQESDSIRGELRRDNVSLKEKLKACLSGKK